MSILVAVLTYLPEPILFLIIGGTFIFFFLLLLLIVFVPHASTRIIQLLDAIHSTTYPGAIHSTCHSRTLQRVQHRITTSREEGCKNESF